MHPRSTLRAHSPTSAAEGIGISCLAHTVLVAAAVRAIPRPARRLASTVRADLAAGTGHARPAAATRPRCRPRLAEAGGGAAAAATTARTAGLLSPPHGWQTPPWQLRLLLPQPPPLQQACPCPPQAGFAAGW